MGENRTFLSGVDKEPRLFFLSATTELQLSMLDGFSAVEELSAAEPVDEKALLNAIHEVLSAELRVKEAHMGLLVRVRNLLTAEQRERLRAIRDGR